MRQLSDTSPEAEQVLIELLRGQTPARRLQKVFEINATVKQFALAGLKRRYPAASSEELQRRFIALRLAPELVKQVYGWDPEIEG